MIGRPRPGKVEFEAGRLVFVHQPRQRALELNDARWSNEKGSVEDCAPLFPGRARVDWLLAHSLNRRGAQRIVNLISNARSHIAACVPAEIFHLSLEKVLLAGRRLCGFGLERGQLGVVVSQMILENARLHINANDEFPAIGDTLESLRKLTRALREHGLYSLRVAKERPHRKRDHRTRVRRPGENAVVRDRSLTDPVYVGG